MNALRRTDPKMLAYLAYMVQRLVVMRTLLRPTGSIYFHCDPTASHYIKVVMDGIFGRQNFVTKSSGSTRTGNRRRPTSSKGCTMFCWSIRLAKTPSSTR